MNRTVTIQGAAQTHPDFYRALGYACEWGSSGYPKAAIFVDETGIIVATYWLKDALKPSFVMVGEVEGERYVFRS